MGWFLVVIFVDGNHVAISRKATFKSNLARKRRIRFHKLNRLAHDRFTERHGAVQGVQNNVGPLDHDPSQQVALFRDAKSRVGVDVAIQPKAKNELIETCLRVLFRHLDGGDQGGGEKGLARIRSLRGSD